MKEFQVNVCMIWKEGGNIFQRKLFAESRKFVFVRIIESLDNRDYLLACAFVQDRGNVFESLRCLGN